MVKIASPTVKIRRRPRRSPSAAAVMMPAANARVNALIVHSSVERLQVPLDGWQGGDDHERVERDHEVGDARKRERPDGPGLTDGRLDDHGGFSLPNRRCAPSQMT